jgi:hypothetical protein
LQKNGVEISASLQESAPGSRAGRQARNLAVDAAKSQEVKIYFNSLSETGAVGIIGYY